METLGHRIHFIRGQKVMLDADLAELYADTTKRFNELDTGGGTLSYTNHLEKRTVPI